MTSTGTIETAEAKQAIALEYLKRLDRGEDFFTLFDEHIQFFFPKVGLVDGLDATKDAFGKVASMIKAIKHDYAYFNYVVSGDTVVVEGTSAGTTTDGSEWRAGVTHAGRFCDVLEVRDGLIHRLYVYLDPDYADADIARYPWLVS